MHTVSQLSFVLFVLDRNARIYLLIAIVAFFKAPRTRAGLYTSYTYVHAFVCVCVQAMAAADAKRLLWHIVHTLNTAIGLVAQINTYSKT